MSGACTDGSLRPDRQHAKNGLALSVARKVVLRFGNLEKNLPYQFLLYA